MATGEKQQVKSSLRDDVEVAVIGNGPSAIALSFLLTGYRPYWNGQVHPNEYLAPKLAACEEQSILDQDLEFLSEGLSGRCNNPVSLLYDQLLLPDADLGCQAPPVVKWRHHPELAIDHVVLGRGCVGGSWANMPADLQSLSYARWLQLPDMSITDFIRQMSKSETSAIERGRCGVVAHYYQQYVRRKNLHTHFFCSAEVTQIRRLDHLGDQDSIDGSPFLSVFPLNSCCVSLPSCSPSPLGQQLSDPFSSACITPTTAAESRLCTMSVSPSPASSVPITTTAAASHCGCMSTSSSESLSSQYSATSIGDDVLVPCIPHSNTSSPASSSSSASSITDGYEEKDSGVDTQTMPVEASSAKYNWSVCGCHSRKPFHFNAKQVVVAVGTSDEPRRLNVPGEGMDLLSYGCPTPGRLRSIAGRVSCARPLVVVGCGLTAADTVLLALQYNLPVVHVFGRPPSDTSLVVNRMPAFVYPEYSRISKLMQARVGFTDKPLVFDSAEPYISLPCHHIVSVSPESCTLQDSEQRDVILPCSYIFVAAGSRPNLSFLPQSGQNLAFEPSADFDSRANPVDVDMGTFESTRMPDLYAMGPLVGDNFVRFAIGASLGITKSLVSKLRRS
eukprot:scpid44830/ scgid13229/ Oxidative stress-induced growth inhibitor 1; Ovary, kidney and liver protein 38; Pregnancy-induced growth inhibitor OKL38